MPVILFVKVQEQIHHSYYFKTPIVLHFEKYDNAGNLITFTKNGLIKSPIQVNNHFVFLEQETGITHILNVEQIVACMEID